MSTFNNWKTLDYTDFMSDLVDRFNQNSGYSSVLDEVLGKIIATGVIPKGTERVNGLAIGTHVNLKDMLPGLSNVQFTGFTFYFKSINKVFSDSANVDLSSYADGVMHFLYLKPDYTFEVLNSPYEGDGDYLYLAKFFATGSGIDYFYITCNNVGSGAFNVLGMSYDVLDGIQPVALADLTLKMTSGSIKYSGIDLSSYNPDIINETFDNTAIGIRYITSGTGFNKVDWSADAVSNIITNKKMNYSTGALSNVTSGKFSCQKVYYDVNSRDLVIQYGGVAYDTMLEAESGATNFTYDAPDGKGTYIPVSILIIKSGATDLTQSTDFEVLNISGKSASEVGSAIDSSARATANSALTQAQNAQSTADSASSTASSAASDASEALTKANNALNEIGNTTTSGTVKYNLNEHVNNTSNPHNVTKAQVGLGNVNNTSDADKPLSTAQKNYVDGAIDGINTTLAGMPDFSETPQVFVQDIEPTGTVARPLKLGDIWFITEE